MAFYQLVANKIKAKVQSVLENCSLTIYFGQGAHVEGHSGIMSFNSEEIIFKRKKGLIKLIGKNLTLTEISQTDAYVKGSVTMVESGEESDG